MMFIKDRAHTIREFGFKKLPVTIKLLKLILYYIRA